MEIILKGDHKREAQDRDFHQIFLALLSSSCQSWTLLLTESEIYTNVVKKEYNQILWIHRKNHLGQNRYFFWQ